VPLFWLNYRYPDGRFAGAVVLEATALIIARMQAAVFRLDDGLYFASGHEIDAVSAQRIPESMIGRLLDKGDLRKLHRMLIQKRPPAPSVKVRPVREPRRQRTNGEPSAPSVRRRATAKKAAKR
jgi:hypothetical protein